MLGGTEGLMHRSWRWVYKLESVGSRNAVILSAEKRQSRYVYLFDLEDS